MSSRGRFLGIVVSTWILVFLSTTGARATQAPPGTPLGFVPSPSIHERTWLELQDHPQPEPAYPLLYVVAPEAGEAAASSRLSRVVFGFLTEITDLSYIRWDLLSHVAYFAVALNSDGSVGSSAWPSGAYVTALRNTAHANGVKVILTANNFSANGISTLLSSATNQQNAISQLLALVQGYGDGVNIDLENVPASQKANLVTFMTDLTAAFHAAIPGSHVTLDTPAIDKNDAFDYDQLAINSDGLFIMAYDYYYTGSTTAGPSAPLSSGGVWPTHNVTWTVNDYLTYGGTANRSKFILGVPYYGNEWPTASTSVPSTATAAGTSWRYDKIHAYATTYGRLWDAASQTPYYVYTSGGVHQGWYDDAESLGYKWDLVNSNDLGGTGIWVINYDTSDDLLWNQLQAKFTTSAPSTGTINVNATLDGSPWSGNVGLNLNGPSGLSIAVVPITLSSETAGTYSLSYVSGGPTGATVSGITPSPSQVLSAGGAVTFTVNFTTASTGTINIYATLDGAAWSGSVSYQITGTHSYTGGAVPGSVNSAPAGSYTLSYVSGGPAGATLSGIQPSASLSLSAGGSITWTLAFTSTPTGTININATLDGAAWSGSVSYQITGTHSYTGGAVPGSVNAAPAGSYTLSYVSGGPAGATLSGIQPSASLSLSAGGSITWTLAFTTYSGAVITEFSVGISPGATPEWITSGPDGNLWFTEFDGNRIGRISPAGAITEFSAGITPGAGPIGITIGPDGNIWFTEALGNRIGRITIAGAVTEFSVGITSGAGPIGITIGPDGNLWFTEFDGNKIGRITTAGQVTEFSNGMSPAAGPQGITAGPDGNLWFTEYYGNRIGRITPTGVITQFSVGITPGAFPGWITAGLDGNLWFTGGSAAPIGRITTSGAVTDFSTGISAGAAAQGITVGPDGNIWFTEFNLDRVGRITPAGVVTEFSTGITGSSRVWGITAGPDGNIWFAEGAGRIGTLAGEPGLGPQSQRTLTVTKAGTGTGTVSSSPSGISCGATCSASFTAGRVVTLTASADPGSNFTGWSGDCIGPGPCLVTMIQARNVTATFTVSGGCTSPSIISQPQSQSIQSGQTATLYVSATGTAPLSYQWYQGSSGDTSHSVGTITASFTTPALSSTTSYWVRVSNSCGYADSATATITVSSSCTAASITWQPQSQTITSGQTATLSVGPSGTSPFTYQWYQGTSGNTSSPVGSNSNVYTTPALTATTSYWVMVSNACGSVNSATATITVNSSCTAPSITTQPQSQSIQSGQTATLFVTATGTAPLSYQWYQGFSGDTSHPVGTNTASFTTPALSTSTSYWVRVSNSCGYADSVTATVSIGCTPPSINSQPQSQSIPSGQTATLYVSATGTAPLSYQWYQGSSGNTSIPIGTNATSFTTPPLTATASYWVLVSNSCGYAGSATATVSISCTPPSITSQPQSQSIQSGQTATLYVGATGTTPLSYQWYQGSSGNTSTPVGANSASFTTPALTATANYWVQVSNACGVTASFTATVSINCQAPALPTASFTYWPPNPKVGDTIYFTDTSTGGPTSWTWTFGDGYSSAFQNPVYAYSQARTYTVTMTAANCKGSSTPVSKVVTVAPQCAFTALPGLAVNYSPNGALTGFPEQQQPMVGQVVTFDPSASTNIDANTTWNWAVAGGTFVAPSKSTDEKPVVTFNSPVLTTVIMNATNCAGMSWYNGSVQIYPDVRHVTADFSWDATSPTTGSIITFTAVTDFAHGDPDTFTWNFGDNTPAQAGRTTIHSYSCSGNYNVTLTASGHGQTSAPAVKPIGVTGKMCGLPSLMVVDAANTPGLNGTYWQTDVRIFNPAPDPSAITIWFLPVGQDNSAPESFGLMLQPRATWSVDNIIGWANRQLGTSYTKTALRVTYDNSESMAPVVVSRTYTQAQGGGTYGQYTPSIGVVPGTTPPTLWVTGVRNNGTSSSTPGFRTNYSIVNLRGDPGGIYPVTITLMDPTGTEQKSVTLGIPPFGYFQGSIASLFGAQFANIGPFALRVDVPDGMDLQFYASVADNQTGAPTMIPAGVAGTSPIYIPAIGHNPGLNGSVWRSDLQLTNPDSASHTWEIKFSPSKSGLPPVSAGVTLTPKNTWRQDDIVSWVYGSLQTPDTSGVVRIACTDGSNVYPVVASSSYNLTASGTFGQSNTPLTAAMGVSPTSTMQHLLLTAMSSADIARTNLGFINLAENDGVYFLVIFYDQSGNVLNPIDSGTGQPKPYALGLNAGGWLQAQLETFFSVLGTTLPAGNKAISAEVTVLAGGPGFAYATVTDNITNDPMFVPAQLAP